MADIVVGTTEAETLTLAGDYLVEDNSNASGGQTIKSTGTGTATGAFTGEDGTYEFAVNFFNENDGASEYVVYVNGIEVETWTGAGGSSGWVIDTHAFQLDLNAGDVITIEGSKNAGEYARIDTITVTDASLLPPPPPPPAADIGLGRTEAEDLILTDGFITESRSTASNDAVIRAEDGATTSVAEGQFTGADGDYLVRLSHLDESDGVSAYQIKVNGQVITSWLADADNDVFNIHEASVALETGDQISVEAVYDSGEKARIDWIEIVEDESIAPISHTLNPEDYDYIAFTGQSNAERYFYRHKDDESPGDIGSVVFEDSIEAYLNGDTTLINAAKGGSGSNPLADANSYWWNVDTDSPGPALLTAVSKIDAALNAGEDLDAIIWAQGEDDARAIDGSNTSSIVDALIDATTSVFEYLWNRYGTDIPVFIQELGDFPELGPWLDGPEGALSAIRDAQAYIASLYDNVYIGATTTDVDEQMDDGIHFNVEGFGLIAEELAETVANVLTGEVLA